MANFIKTDPWLCELLASFQSNFPLKSCGKGIVKEGTVMNDDFICFLDKLDLLDQFLVETFRTPQGACRRLCSLPQSKYDIENSFRWKDLICEVSSKFGLGSFFNDISTFMGYLIPKPSLKKNSSDNV